MPTALKDSQVSIRLPAELHDGMETYARLTGRTKSFYITQAICAHLDNLEDVYLAEQRLIDIRAGRSRTLSLDEVEKNLGLED